MSKAQREAEQRRRRTKVVVAWIDPGDVAGDFAESLAGLYLAEARDDGLIGGHIRLRSGPRIAEARSQVVETFLNTEMYRHAEWLFMVDSDMTFTADVLRRLVNVAHPTERPIMGGLCFAGSSPENMYPTVYSLEPSEEGWVTEVVREYPEDSLVKVGATGAAAMLVHRNVLKMMYHHFELLPNGQRNNYPWFVEGHVDAHGRPFGEDVAFCIKAQAIGIPVHIHTGIAFGHCKQIVLDADLWEGEQAMTVDAIIDTLGRTPAQLVPTIERYLYGNQRTQLNRLNGAMTATATTATFEFAADGIRPGAYIEVDDEVLYVWSVAAQVATVQRGMLGTTAAAHLTQAVMRVEPRFMRSEMVDEIAKEVRSWPTNVYCRLTGDVEWPSSAAALDLLGIGRPGITLLRAQRSPSGDEDRWYRVEGVRIERRQNQVDFPSGYALITPGGSGINGGRLRVTLRAPFDTSYLTSTTDLGWLGLTNDLVDIIPWGVAGRLLMTRDIARTDASAQGRSRPAEEVRAGDAVQVGNAMLQMRDRLLAEAANRLLAEDGMGHA